ncbi:hypothetical protein A2631_04335 [Candidatus Daviesbacteria bacterium RIFCSPHIGHO2_01_FULL_44_29]|uniref:50S ribosomal protein L22 n=1 Tax=Candidatus Daviesbacteria bacterium RIFCSPHIGHO2_02_FULL_43_12 TaxID=1797776 RepID=A0A1F5KH66_9BACT|nr:MAG: hypothetical protein A2631_04335 [Candidatus Daviesbacteria bacterium RIFCSPHIGHO2_01_FULL_44_29]OGE39951.1 MAG: hypothetical protein A3D25_04065 [Candidatus Daviesbacteria bacterium RIFCSPHIGHO2_02_FULL_43_12]OGE40492.1 MAG: hypothetical protein A3E86_00720 [Candidatus Daviesbacteria bacterium RIFCSPHIGHO2_12_FULL_47_45]OGE70368.1 MAG: hypothetical protein A3B55_01505 [Candidatus Daviesbacteria bacterium RIFCSPLOWO2_01_FULL_43_15]
MDEFTTIQKNLGHTPRKLRLVADMIRKMSPNQALEVLKFTNRAAAVDLAKAIKTALANAGAHQDHVVFKTIEVNEGLKMKRYRVGTAGRGRGRPYKKRTSHIKIVLGEMPESSGKSLEFSKVEKRVKKENTKEVTA